MKLHYRNIAAILLTGIWLNVSEFFRNEVLLKSYWVNHYQTLGMKFPSEPLNGMVWVVWGFLYASALFTISRKFSLIQTALLSWLVGFVLMWVVAWNLNVLPMSILVYAVPLSLLEVFVASYICIASAKLER
jgi:hypothetical protein